MSDPTAPGNPLDQVIADYLQAAEAGRVPSRQALLDAHPEHADDLRAFFADYDRLDNRADALKLATHRPPADRPKVRYFGNYELLEEIAEGGMGLVYKARQRSLNRDGEVYFIAPGAESSAQGQRRSDFLGGRGLVQFRLHGERANSYSNAHGCPPFLVSDGRRLQYSSVFYVGW